MSESAKTCTCSAKPIAHLRDFQCTPPPTLAEWLERLDRASRSAVVEIKPGELATVVKLVRAEVKRGDRAVVLQSFKNYVHKRLDAAGVPADPEPEKNAEHGCRIEGRLNWVLARINPPLHVPAAAPIEAGALEPGEIIAVPGHVDLRSSAECPSCHIVCRINGCGTCDDCCNCRGG